MRGSKPQPQLQSFPVASAVEDEQREELLEVEEEIHRDEECIIKVTQSPGFLCHIEATAAFRLPAGTMFKQVITHPDNAAIFRHMERCSYRQVLRDDGHGHRQVRVAHEASWRLLMFSGKFTTRLLVEEDDSSDEVLVMDFQLDPQGGRSGIMKRFHGRWTIRPHPKDPQHASLSTLDQDLALGVSLPPPFDRILKRISCNQVKHIFEDVKKEADKVNRGKPTLCPWEEVCNKSIGEQLPLDEAQLEGQGKQEQQEPAAGAGTAERASALLAMPVEAATESAAGAQPGSGADVEAAAEQLAALSVAKG